MAHSLGDASVQRYQVSGLHIPWKRPIIEEHPGPPLNLNIGRRFNTQVEMMGRTYQRVNGAVSGLCLASKNQNHWHQIGH